MAHCSLMITASRPEDGSRHTPTSLTVGGGLHQGSFLGRENWRRVEQLLEYRHPRPPVCVTAFPCDHLTDSNTAEGLRICQIEARRASFRMCSECQPIPPTPSSTNSSPTSMINQGHTPHGLTTCVMHVCEMQI